jgi:hypothetical protein
MRANFPQRRPKIGKCVKTLAKRTLVFARIISNYCSAFEIEGLVGWRERTYCTIFIPKPTAVFFIHPPVICPPRWVVPSISRDSRIAGRLQGISDHASLGLNCDWPSTCNFVRRRDRIAHISVTLLVAVYHWLHEKLPLPVSNRDASFLVFDNECHGTNQAIPQTANGLSCWPDSPRFQSQGSGRQGISTVRATWALGTAVLLPRLLVTVLHDGTARVRAAEQRF